MSIAPFQTELSRRMRALADKIGGTAAADLREKADAFDRATEAHNNGTGGPDSAKRMLGAWARARRAYCGATGDPLV